MVCGARTKTGPCQRPPELGRRRCWLHGGAPGSGAPAGAANGNYRHGRHSAERRAQRRAEAAERNRRSNEWAATVPKIDYAKICAQLDALRAAREDDES